MIAMQHNVEISATNVSPMFPYPKMDTEDAHTLIAENESIENNRSCSDGCGCGKHNREESDGLEANSNKLS